MNRINEQNDIPVALLEELKKHTGGYILFYSNAHGDSSFLPCVEESAKMAGLMLHAKKLSEAFENRIAKALGAYFG